MIKRIAIVLSVAPNEYKKCETIITAFHKDHLKLMISGKHICFEHLPQWIIKDYVIVKIYNSVMKCVCQEHIRISLHYMISLSGLDDGEYTIHLYYKSNSQSNTYIGINSSKGLPLQVVNDSVSFVVAKPFEENKRIFMELSEKFVKEHDNSIVPYNNFIPEEIVKLAQKIIRHSYSNYDKIMAVHDWVADNVYYDYDSLSDGSYRQQKHDALSVIKRKRTVCSGYSELTKILLKAVGIYAINMDCFALGYMTNGDWNMAVNMECDANHVITFAYADDKWLMMDTTWDSDNEYKNGKYIRKAGYGVSHQYFDCTLAFFSYTHRFIK